MDVGAECVWKFRYWKYHLAIPPCQVGALATWAVLGQTNSATAGVSTDGTLWTWGNGASGVLGHSNITSYSSPVQVGALTTWSQVASGQTHFMMLKTDGTIWGWGANSSGQLGQGAYCGS